MQAVDTHFTSLPQRLDSTVDESHQAPPNSERLTSSAGVRVERQAPPVQWEPHVQRLSAELGPYVVSPSLFENIRPDEHGIYTVKTNGETRFYTFAHDRAVQVGNFNPKERSWRLVNSSTGRADGPEISERTQGDWGIDRQGGSLWNYMRGIVRDAADKVAEAYHVLKNNQLGSRMLSNLKKLFGSSIDTPQGKARLLEKLQRTWQELRNSDASGGRNLYTTPYLMDGSDDSPDAYTSGPRVIFSEFQLTNRPRGLLVGKMIHEINHTDNIRDIDNWYVSPNLGRMGTYERTDMPPFTFDNALHNPDTVQYAVVVLTGNPQLGLVATRLT
ncbi:MAG TPA: hypothetical protein VMA74_15690 [Dyella sp.]|uniref:hypothetical protein n=1 Tax=Dyella sp. TaxID=1869338 RepID=UPI002B86520F|nr:hypothetical protein [Dyella sp.]HUB91167.1 hypothetical protein [Dyella sp.]